VSETDGFREITKKGNKLLSKIQGDIGVNINSCYQCERCTNSCPVAEFMDIKPHQVIRYVQLGYREEVLNSRTIWVCLSCEMCTAHCPNEVGVAEVIICFRNWAAQSHFESSEGELEIFYRKFLKELNKFGRINEMWLMASLNMDPKILFKKLQSAEIFSELKLAYTLMSKGRLHFLPKKSNAVKELRKIKAE